MKKTTLATGADIKNRFLIGKGKILYSGPDIGDLIKADNYKRFKKAICRAAKKNKPGIIACDLHPGYFSTRFARNYCLESKGCVLREIQHHHAHIASVIYEHELKRPVVGVCFDGTGYGSDRRMWGGEFLLVDKTGFKRLAHLKYRKMPGADKVVSEPWRMALSILGEEAVPFLDGVKKSNIDIARAMILKDVNSPLTSSAGRIFDAAAAMIAGCAFASYEAEGPIKLEAMCENTGKESYPFTKMKDNRMTVIDAIGIFRGIASDLKKKKNKRFIASKFHNSIVKIIVDVVKGQSKRLNIKDIALSGGVFQNKYLKVRVIELLTDSGMRVYTNKDFPASDLNIALGQYHVARDL